ncbi:hypothetical protein ABZX69_39740 [Streptomyces sp. NPDC004074]|uniref:hypothetical protein n=1 Tax=Streptomyces sp. NPDC004074 TaxID=3154277 RepID=UPI0033A68999
MLGLLRGRRVARGRAQGGEQAAQDAPYQDEGPGTHVGQVPSGLPDVEDLADGRVTGYRERWREGGAASGDRRTERFDDEESARVFGDAVDEAGQNWPPGWVEGRGCIEPDSTDADGRSPRTAGFGRRWDRGLRGRGP